MTGRASLPASEWAYRSIGDLVAALRGKQISALELTDQFIARIEALDRDINSVVVRDFERARAAAKAADAALARGEQGALLGVPVTIKESYNIADLPTTWGIPIFKDYIPQEDALAVKRLKAAGAVVLGKTNVPLSLGDWQSYNDIYGTTNNPWDKTRSPGGSSGGSSAALAAGFGPLSLGSDIGGSLRVPAHFCGVAAHKPTYGLVASRGHLPPRVPEWVTGRDLAVIGPMALYAEDLTIGLEITAGPDDATDGRAYRLHLPPARHEKLADFRVLLIAEHPLLPTAAPLRAGLEELSQKLAKAGAKVERETPLLPDLASSARVYMQLLNAALSVGYPDERYREIQQIAAGLAADDISLRAELVRGGVLGHREWMQVDFKRQHLKQQWRALFRDFDVIICPPSAVLAFPHDHSLPQAARKISIDGKDFAFVDQFVWAETATSSGLPATVVPIGQSDQGLPFGVQIIGAEYEDRTTLAFARLIEREFGGFVPPPGYAKAA
jgi:amidase